MEYKNQLKNRLKTYKYHEIITKIIPSALTKNEKLFIVGGFIRNQLLDIMPYYKDVVNHNEKDFDLLILSNKDQEDIFERINDKLNKYMFETNKEYIRKVVYINNKSSKLIKVYTHNDNESYDISVCNKYKNKKEKERVIRNLNMRDFDFNAIMYNIIDNKLYIRNKYVFEDLENRVMNSEVVDYVIPNKSGFRHIIQDDPIRVIRGLRFVCKYNLSIHSKALITMHMLKVKSNHNYTTDRLNNEINKIFDSKYLRNLMYYDFIIGQFISPLFEELNAYYSTPEIIDIDESVEYKILKYYNFIDTYYSEFINLCKDNEYPPSYIDIWIALLAGLLRRLYNKPKKKNMDNKIIAFIELELLNDNSMFHINNLGKDIIKIITDKQELHKLEMMNKYKK